MILKCCTVLPWHHSRKMTVPALGAARAATIKNGNNGALACDEYCKGNWTGLACPGGCSSAFDTAANKAISCDTVRGVGEKQVTCYCGGVCTAGAESLEAALNTCND